jgi:hypothetical protein
MEKERLWKRPHHGWEICYNPAPIPIRSFDWVAIHPKYEAWMEDGEWQSNGLCVHAPNRKELLEAIDEWELKNA